MHISKKENGKWKEIKRVARTHEVLPTLLKAKRGAKRGSKDNLAQRPPGEKNRTRDQKGQEVQIRSQGSKKKKRGGKIQYGSRSPGFPNPARFKQADKKKKR